MAEPNVNNYVQEISLLPITCGLQAQLKTKIGNNNNNCLATKMASSRQRQQQKKQQKNSAKT